MNLITDESEILYNEYEYTKIFYRLRLFDSTENTTILMIESELTTINNSNMYIQTFNKNNFNTYENMEDYFDNILNQYAYNSGPVETDKHICNGLTTIIGEKPQLLLHGNIYTILQFSKCAHRYNAITNILNYSFILYNITKMIDDI